MVLELMTPMIEKLSADLMLAFNDWASKSQHESGQHDDSGVQVIITVGNNDLPFDYSLIQWDAWARKLYKLWSPKMIPATTENEEVNRMKYLLIPYRFICLTFSNCPFRHSVVVCIIGHQYQPVQTYERFVCALTGGPDPILGIHQIGRKILQVNLHGWKGN